MLRSRLQKAVKECSKTDGKIWKQNLKADASLETMYAAASKKMNILSASFAADVKRMVQNVNQEPCGGIATFHEGCKELIMSYVLMMTGRVLDLRSKGVEQREGERETREDEERQRERDREKREKERGSAPEAEKLKYIYI